MYVDAERRFEDLEKVGFGGFWDCIREGDETEMNWGL